MQMKEAFVTLPVLRHSGVALVSFIYEERTPKVTTPAVCHQGEGKKGRQGERERERERRRETLNYGLVFPLSTDSCDECAWWLL